MSLRSLMQAMEARGHRAVCGLGGAWRAASSVRCASRKYVSLTIVVKSSSCQSRDCGSLAWYFVVVHGSFLGVGRFEQPILLRELVQLALQRLHFIGKALVQFQRLLVPGVSKCFVTYGEFESGESRFESPHLVK